MGEREKGEKKEQSTRKQKASRIIHSYKKTKYDTRMEIASYEMNHLTVIEPSRPTD